MLPDAAIQLPDLSVRNHLICLELRCGLCGLRAIFRERGRSEEWPGESGLTTLAPDIVAAILDDALPNHITLFDLAVDPPALWDEQRAGIGTKYSACWE